MSNAVSYALQRETSRLEDTLRETAKAVTNAVNRVLQREGRRLEDMMLENGRGRAQTFLYDTEGGNLSIVPAKGADGEETPTPFGCVMRSAMTRSFGAEDEWDGELSRETRRLEEALCENTRGIPQVFSYNTENGNMALVPQGNDPQSGRNFGSICPAAMTGHFGGGESDSAMERDRNLSRETRRLEEALSENTGGTPQVFSYNAEEGNMSLVPYHDASPSEREFGNVCGASFTSDFGGGGAGSEARGMGAERVAGTRKSPLCLPRCFGALWSPVFASTFGGDIQVATLDGDDLIDADAPSAAGTAYTLEEEGVVRILRGRKDALAKGKTDKAVFVRGDSRVQSGQENARYVVRILGNGEARVSEKSSDGEHPIQTVMVVPPKKEHYRLGTGLMESHLLRKRRVLLFGVGSMGGDLALHLAMAGVGNICLVDPDRVEASNLSRLRDAGIADVGRLKVAVMAERIRGKNPSCHVGTVPKDITKEREELTGYLEDTDLALVSTDNRTSRILIAQGLQKVGKTCIYTRCSTRAESGDCFVSRPGGACYECLYGMAGEVSEDIDDWAAAKKAGRLAAYARPEDMGAFAILPGLSTDISAITSFAARLAIWELAKIGGNDPFSNFSEEFSRFNYFLHVNRRENFFLNDAWGPFDKSGQRPCAQRWYGATVSRRDNCPCCGTRANELDTGAEDERFFKSLAQAVC